LADWTSADLAHKVCRRLNITGAGQATSSEDAKVVTDAYDSVYPQLLTHDLAMWDQESIPPQAQLPLEQVMCGKVASFWYSGARLVDYERMGQRGWEELQEQNAAPQMPMPVRQDYY